MGCGRQSSSILPSLDRHVQGRFHHHAVAGQVNLLALVIVHGHLAAQQDAALTAHALDAGLDGVAGVDGHALEHLAGIGQHRHADAEGGAHVGGDHFQLLVQVFLDLGRAIHQVTGLVAAADLDLVGGRSVAVVAAVHPSGQDHRAVDGQPTGLSGFHRLAAQLPARQVFLGQGQAEVTGDVVQVQRHGGGGPPLVLLAIHPQGNAVCLFSHRSGPSGPCRRE